MATTSLKQLENELRDFAKSRKDIKVLGIFGSYAKGTFSDASDVDICIAKSQPLSLEEKINISAELSLLLKKEVDLIDLAAAHGTILQEALHSSVWITRENNAFAGILKKMLFDKADFQPYYDRMLQKKRERFLKK